MTETVTFQHNLPGLQYTWTSGPEACRCSSGTSLMVASVATPQHPVSFPHYSKTFFWPDHLYGAEEVIAWGSKVWTIWRMWKNVPFHFMYAVHGASSHVWTGVILAKWHWCLCSWRLSLLGLQQVLSNIQCLLCDALWGYPCTIHL